VSIEAQILQGLIQRGLAPHVAQGIVANMIAESRLDPGINEIAPLVPGSRGGFGLNQWTGPRRRALEAAATQRGVPVSDLDFQLDYTLEELNGPERGAMNALSRATTAEEAARLYSERFLRPGIPHMDRRLSEARRLAGMGNAAPQGGAQAPQQPANALAGVPGADTRTEVAENPLSRLSTLQQDPAAFMAPNVFAALPAPQYQPRFLTR
jgi:hypothetical protein